MKSSIFIPKTINVGFQNRNDTYTKKLAYVIYYDEKGKLRKETSWNSWRDSKIPNEEFDNMPTSGFVLNKKVGDYDSGWNHRKSYCRVYDPRNFEFEITIENLLYILENTNSIKGKGLEGDFVYGWDGKDLVLIPTESPDYKLIQDYSNIIHNNETIKAKDLIIGATYLDKDNVEHVYMGKFEHYGSGYKCGGKVYKSYKMMRDEHPNYSDYKYVYDVNQGKKFFFCTKSKYSDSGYSFNAVSSINKKFVICTDRNCHQEYAAMFDCLESNTSYSPLDESKYEYVNLSYEEFEEYICNMHRDRYDYRHVMHNNREIHEIKYAYDTEKKEYIDSLLYCHGKDKDTYNNYTCIPYGFKTKIVDVTYNWSRIPRKEEVEIPVSLREIYDIIKPIYRNKYLKNGKFYNKEMYWNE